VRIVRFSEEVKNQIAQGLSLESLEWHWTAGSCNPESGGCLNLPSTDDRFRFYHYLYSNGEVLSSFFGEVVPLVKELEEQTGESYLSRLQRAKVNLDVCQSGYREGCHSTAHVDSNLVDAQSLIYYINDSDGDTYFFDGETSEVTQSESPESGKGILFDANKYHAGSPPRENASRLVLNLVFNPIETNRESIDEH
jgi:hypothetical protein